jgi:hypothetical protein
LNSETGPGILKVSVIDHGIGINAIDFPQTFKQFANGEDLVKFNFDSTGADLYISKLLCLQMKGDIQVYSKDGIGTTFTFCIPAESRVNPDLVQTNNNVRSSPRLTATKDKSFTKSCCEIQFPSLFLTSNNIPQINRCQIMIVDDEPFI